MKQILVFLLCFSACISSNRKELPKDTVPLKDTEAFITDKFGNKERKQLIDSLKWLYYALNYKYEAVNRNNSKLKIKPVQCELALWKAENNKDTGNYQFSAYYKDSTNVYVIIPDHIAGIATVAGRPRYTLGGHFTFDKPATWQAADSFFQNAESEFVKYILDYKGELSSWLQNEIVQRKLNPKQ